MRYRTFLTFDIIGGVLWGAGVTLLGRLLGNVAFVSQHIETILLLIVVLSVLPIVFQFVRARRSSKRTPDAAAV